MLFGMSSFQRPYAFHFAINFTLGKLNDVMDLFSTLTAHYHLILSSNYKLNIAFVGKRFLRSPRYMTYSAFFSSIALIFFSSIEIKKKSDFCSVAIFHLLGDCILTRQLH